MPFTISDFRAVVPTYVREQARTLDWLCAAHTRAELTRAAQRGDRVDEEPFRARMRVAIERFGCGPEAIASRGYMLDDCDHTRWGEMDVYPLDREPRGAGTSARTRAFERIADSVLERVDPADAQPPSDLLHVTCTGYAAPSAAQQLVARRGWATSTRVTHVYHMGCYAAFPALRLACGAQAVPRQTGAAPRSQIVHTEVCSLHVDPSNHAPEQLVIQSLFADGFIAYDVMDAAVAPIRTPGFELLALLERIVPDSASAMTWRCSEWGMQMTLLRDVPKRLAAALSSFVSELGARAGFDEGSVRDATYAVHPGGPRILDCVQDALRLRPAQLETSRKVLRERGNMSSATLPHVWMDIARDANVSAGAPVVSLAFGPGLTLCGAVMRKILP